MIRVTSTFTLVGLMVGLMLSMTFTSSLSWAQPAGFAEKMQPIHADKAWPAGKFEVDYNLADNQGYRHGIWIRVYDDGSLYYRGEFDHGQPSGQWWFFRPNGSAMSSITYTEGSEVSSAVMFNDEGRIAATGEYWQPSIKLTVKTLEDRPTIPLRHGKWSFFDPKGRLAAVTHFEAGQKHGLDESYQTNGKVSETGQFVEGKRHGEWRRNLDNGLLQQLITFNHGVLQGPFQAYYDDGKRLCEGAYEAGKEEGAWMYYNEDGTLHEIDHYEEGNLTNTIRVNGTFTEFYSEDRPKSEVMYRDKMKDGPFREWHDQGEYVIDSQQDPQFGGTVNRRIMKGLQVSREGDYVKDKLDGSVYYYDTRGRLLKTEHYDRGKLLRTDAQ